MYFVGIDWADQKYDVTIVDNAGKVVSTNLTIQKKRIGFEKFVDHLRSFSVNLQDFKIGIETPNNLLVDFLIDLGYSVLCIMTRSMNSFRKRYRTSGQEMTTSILMFWQMSCAPINSVGVKSILALT